MRWFVSTLAPLRAGASTQARPEFLASASAFGAKDCLFSHLEPGSGWSWDSRGHRLI